MSSFLPINTNKLGSIVTNGSQGLPPQISTAIGNTLGQTGNNKIVQKIQNIADKAGVQGLNGSLIKQQSAFPYKKSVSFFLKNRSGTLIDPQESNGEGDNFKKGYFFKMHVNPSNFTIAQPVKTVVPVRTLGGWKLQYWYPDLGSIRADGLIGNMLERFNRDLKDSVAWRGFRKLLKVYNTNGIPYTTAGKSSRSQFQQSFAPIAVCIFDKNQYEGYFESLEYTESEETPHTIKYSFSFKFVNNLQLDDIPGITRESSIDASIMNALVPQGSISKAISSAF